MSVVLASDHAGVALKNVLSKYFAVWRLPEIYDLGTHNPNDSVDYPDFAHLLCKKMMDNGYRYRGVLICGTGIGMSIVANRYEGIRCAVATSPEMAEMARRHNDANVLALGARIIDNQTAIAIVNAFFGTAYDDGGRHDQRLAKINIKKPGDEENGVRGIFNPS